MLDDSKSMGGGPQGPPDTSQPAPLARIEDICRAYANGRERGLAVDPSTAQTFLEEIVKVYTNEELATAFRLGYEAGRAAAEVNQRIGGNIEEASALIESLQAYQMGLKAAGRIIVEDYKSPLASIILVQETADIYRANLGTPYCDAFVVIPRLLEFMQKHKQSSQTGLRYLQQIMDGSVRSTPVAFATRNDHHG